MSLRKSARYRFDDFIVSNSLVSLMISQLAENPPARGRVVIMTLSATTAAGFESGKTYAVRMMRGKTVLARCELLLRER